jgi:uncharacterized damage-inducible protein DinB
MDKGMGVAMSTAIFRKLAEYNRWANARIYAAAFELSEEQFKRPIGAFFESMHGTLNHLLATDLIWLKRLTAEGDAPNRLDFVLHDHLRELATAREAQDRRIVSVVEACEEADLDRVLQYVTTKGQPLQQRIGDVLLNLFNHQTHHRGQAHACYSILTGSEPPVLDLLQFQLGQPAPDLLPLI